MPTVHKIERMNRAILVICLLLSLSSTAAAQLLPATGDLSDVTLTSPQTGHKLEYDATLNGGQGGWKNVADTGGGSFADEEVLQLGTDNDFGWVFSALENKLQLIRGSTPGTNVVLSFRTDGAGIGVNKAQSIDSMLDVEAPDTATRGLTITQPGLSGLNYEALRIATGAGGVFGIMPSDLSLANPDWKIRTASNEGLEITKPGDATTTHWYFHPDGRIIGDSKTFVVSDPKIVLGGTRTGGGNAHAFVDEITYNRTGAAAINSYDSRTIVQGADAYDHFVSFQSRPVYQGTTSIDRFGGFTSFFTLDGPGTTNIGYHFRARDADGVGPLNTQYGLWISEALTRGSSANWAVYTEGATASSLGGDLYVGGDDATAPFVFDVSNGSLTVLPTAANGLRITPSVDATQAIFNVTNAANTANWLTVGVDGEVRMYGTGGVDIQNQDVTASGNVTVGTLYLDDGGAQEVTYGAVDSGGTGFKVLRIPN